MNFRVTKDTMVPMRDGTRLATDLWIPEDPSSIAGTPIDGVVTSWPTLLVRLPYSKDIFPAAEFDYPTMPNIFRLLDAGYAIVCQDCRGTGQSEGSFVPLINEPNDGADTIAWLREQRWCDGSIGTYGHSYLGMTQWATASTAPEGLKAMVSTITSTDAYRGGWYSEGGAFSWHMFWAWTGLMAMLPTNDAARHPMGPEAIGREALQMLDNAQEHLAHLPLVDQPLFEKLWPWWTDALTHAACDSYWRERSPIEDIDKVTAPALHIGGWYDVFVNDTARAFSHAKRAAAPQARSEHRLIVGPWDHMHYSGEYLDRQFGVDSSLAATDLTQTYLDYFDRHVKGDSAAPELAPVRIFVMGIDTWREEQDWPLPGTKYTEYYLASEQGANTRTGDGTLTTELSPVVSSDTFTYDPTDPVPTIGGRVLLPASLNAVGPVDQQEIEDRPDVLCYSTPILTEPVEITGHITATLFVSTSAIDTDFTAKLVDVFPDGRAIYLTDGILRLRYRASLDVAELARPGATNEITVDMGVTSNVFQPGHQARVEISSSNFPRYDRNTNTGADNAKSGSTLSAINTLHLGGPTSSRITLPVIPTIRRESANESDEVSMPHRLYPHSDGAKGASLPVPGAEE